MKTIRLTDVIKTYQRIDLYRAKYRSPAFTPHAWCFHGDKAQTWTGTCGGSLLKINGSTQYGTGISIDAATYKYVSIRLGTPRYVPASKQYRLTFSYTSDTTYTKQVIMFASGSLQTVLMDMSGAPGWSGNVTQIGFSMEVESALNSNTWIPFVMSMYCEYIKIDQENVFANVCDAPTATVVDFNEMRSDIETFAGQTISWDNPGPTTNPNRVRQFVDTIRASDLDQVNAKITTLAPYNGCAACDDYQCSCNALADGFVDCLACNGCNQFAPCTTCDVKCHEEARTCACNGATGCYQQPSACSCNAKCNSYSSCSCNSTCNGQGTSCTICNTCNSESTSCTCDHRGHILTCGYESGDCIDTPTCTWCFVTSDSGGRSTGTPCKCNSTCNNQPGGSSAAVTCKVACYSGFTACSIAYGVTTTCATCNGACNTQSSSCSCNSKCYGYSSCSNCDGQCYGQPTACGCHTLCHLETRPCTCNSKCYLFNPCLTCNSCNGYIKCTCDQTCHQESCEQCHQTGYSTVPI